MFLFQTEIIAWNAEKIAVDYPDLMTLTPIDRKLGQTVNGVHPV
jgi:hypothetical protein